MTFQWTESQNFFYFLVFIFLAVSTIQACYVKKRWVVFLNCTKFSGFFLLIFSTLAPSSSHEGFLGIRLCTYLGTSCWRSRVPSSLVQVSSAPPHAGPFLQSDSGFFWFSIQSRTSHLHKRQYGFDKKKISRKDP